MSGRIVCLVSFLSYEEGILLYNALQDAGISALVKSAGPPSLPYGEGLYFQLLVTEENLETAQEITKDFQLEIAANRQRIICPRCKSEAVFKPKTLPFWQKIYYTGTEVFECGNCGKKFGK